MGEGKKGFPLRCVAHHRATSVSITRGFATDRLGRPEQSNRVLAFPAGQRARHPQSISPSTANRFPKDTFVRVGLDRPWRRSPGSRPSPKVAARPLSNSLLGRAHSCTGRLALYYDGLPLSPRPARSRRGQFPNPSTAQVCEIVSPELFLPALRQKSPFGL